MKKLFFLMAILLAGCSHIAVKSTAEKDLNVSELSATMAYGFMRELNDLDPDIEKDLLVRLYQNPIFGESCFIETQGVCRNNYYLAVSTFDEFPESTVFKLKMVGEVTEIQWIRESKYDYVEIEFILNSYTKKALTNNKSLVRVHKT